MIPKIRFEYSWIYDQNWREWIKLYPRWANMKYPSTTKVRNYIKKVEKIWTKHDKKILKEMSKISGLKWGRKNITCYIVGLCRPFSSPLTMPTYKQTDWFIDVLTHELIHNIFFQKGNFKKVERAWDYFEKKYEKESRGTKNHIVLHAIHHQIYIKLFGKKRLERDIRIMKKAKDYKKSWEIVQKEGAENIIKEFRKRLK